VIQRADLFPPDVSTPETFKVLFIQAEAVELSTKGLTGFLYWRGEGLVIHGDKDWNLPLKSISSVNLVRVSGGSKMIKLTHSRGTVFLSVIRFSFRGMFMFADYYRTRELYGRMRAYLEKKSYVDPRSGFFHSFMKRALDRRWFLKY